MGKMQILATCPECGKNLQIEAESHETVPTLRCKLEPSARPFEYHITSKQIAEFVTEKARQYAPNVKVEIGVKYCMAKKKKDDDEIHSYANFRIAFSEKDILPNNNDLGWYGQFGNGDNVNVIPSMMKNIIEKYGYNPDYVKKWLSSYEIMEKLEDRFGMSEAYIKDLAEFSHVRRIMANNGGSKEPWIMFAAEPSNIIRDMMTDPATGQLPGKLTISAPIELQKDGEIVYTVTLRTETRTYEENPNVRALLMGGKEKK